MTRRLPRLITAALLLGLVGATTAQACEKHLNGHQNSSDTAGEAANR